MSLKTIEISGPKENFLNLPDENGWLQKMDTKGASEDDGKGNWCWVLTVNTKDRLTKEALAAIKKHGLIVKDLSKKAHTVVR